MKILLFIFELLLKLVGGEKLSPEEILTPQDAADIQEEEETSEIELINAPIEEAITSNFHWIIDPGHGPRTKGKRSLPLPEDGYVFFEWEYNHHIARLVCSRLKELNIAHSQSVQLSERLGNDLVNRVGYANDLESSKPKRFVSIHANAAKGGDKRWIDDTEGTETFIFTNAKKESREMALNFNTRICNLLQSTNRGVKTANFYVLRKTKMPACLIEVDFFTNKQFVRLSRSEAHRQAVADAIVSSILELEAFSVIPFA